MNDEFLFGRKTFHTIDSLKEPLKRTIYNSVSYYYLPTNGARVTLAGARPRGRAPPLLKQTLEFGWAWPVC